MNSSLPPERPATASKISLYFMSHHNLLSKYVFPFYGSACFLIFLLFQERRVGENKKTQKYAFGQRRFVKLQEFFSHVHLPFFTFGLTAVSGL